MKKIAICLLLSISIIIGLSSCANDAVDDVSSALTESETQSEASTSSEKEETSSKASTSSKSKEDNSSKVETSSEENSSKESSSKRNPNRVSSNKQNDKTEVKTVYKTLMELWSADLKVGDTIELALDDYCKGEYEVVSGNYEENGFSVISITSNKFAVRKFDSINSWTSKLKSGSYIAHKGFNGYIDNDTLKKKSSTNGTYPQNTMESVDHAVRLGFKAVEIDITVTKDDVWVLSHDANTTVLSSGTGEKFTDLNYADIKDQYIKKQWKSGGYWNFSDNIAKEYVPTLKSVLEYLRGKGVYVILDAKFMSHHEYDDREMDALANIIISSGMKDYCMAYAGCHDPLSKRIPGIIAAYSQMSCSTDEASYNEMKSRGNFMLSVASTKYKDFAAFAKKYDVPVAVWIVEDYAEAEEFFDNGVDYVLTDFCLDNPNLSDYKTVKSFALADISGGAKTFGTVNLSADKVAMGKKSWLQTNLSFEGLGLKPGDIISVKAKTSAEGFLKVETIGAPVLRETQRNIKGEQSIYYIVNDVYKYDLAVIFGTEYNEADFSNIEIKILRETARGEK
ncbi:MAG: hypothetical protein IJ370_08030 [Oscillospiraceae bacterium]|nr:hypothetical protein [Oscillospiraceae bacterium]